MELLRQQAQDSTATDNKVMERTDKVSGRDDPDEQNSPCFAATDPMIEKDVDRTVIKNEHTKG